MKRLTEDENRAMKEAERRFTRALRIVNLSMFIYGLCCISVSFGVGAVIDRFNPSWTYFTVGGLILFFLTAWVIVVGPIVREITHKYVAFVD